MKWNLPPDCPQQISNRHGEFTISMHAMQQFYWRLTKVRPDLPKEKKDSIHWFYKKFKKYMVSADQRERKNAVGRIISHGFRKAKYYVNQYVKWVFVVEEDTNTILTCYPYDPAKELYK